MVVALPEKQPVDRSLNAVDRGLYEDTCHEQCADCGEYPRLTAQRSCEEEDRAERHAVGSEDERADQGVRQPFSQQQAQVHQAVARDGDCGDKREADVTDHSQRIDVDAKRWDEIRCPAEDRNEDPDAQHL